MDYQGVIFDFDGTLVNTLEDLAACVNLTLERFGLPTHPLDAYRTMVGNGAENLIRRAAPGQPEERIQELLAFYGPYYRENGTRYSKPYPGIPELLHTLSERGVKLAVLSNKPDDATRALVARYFPAISFTAVCGAQAGVPIKPDPTGVFRLLSQMEIGERCLFCGDSNVDMLTAKNAGLKSCGVLWGFRDGEELQEAGACYLAAQPADILELFQQD